MTVVRVGRPTTSLASTATGIELTGELHRQSRESVAAPSSHSTGRAAASSTLGAYSPSRRLAHAFHSRRVLVVQDDEDNDDDASLVPYAGLPSPKASWCRLAFSLRSAMLLFLERAAAAANDAARLNG